MALNIVISSGKGGTGKTFIASNLFHVLEKQGKEPSYLDCDVEAPNGHLFLNPEIHAEEKISILSPAGIDAEKCTACGKCVETCQYNALALIKQKVLLFQNLCHVCGACSLICPENAILKEKREIGTLLKGKSGKADFAYGLLKTGEGGMSPRVIKKVKELAGQSINILDSPPGTACPVVETVRDADLCLLVTDPTPFGINDLKLAVQMCRSLDKEPLVIVNRADYKNDDLQQYCLEQKLEILGEIPDDRKIAENYSKGQLAVDQFAEYENLFKTMADKILEKAENPPTTQKIQIKEENNTNLDLLDFKPEPEPAKNSAKEIVVISGKGGTGKTSLTAAFCSIEEKAAIADLDVDAADLFLIMDPQNKKQGHFSGGNLALLDSEKCSGCGICASHCQFDAIFPTEQGKFRIDDTYCEGCSACAIVCPENAIHLEKAINGKWYLSQTRFGPMAHAKLGTAEENSGKLVSLVRDLGRKQAEEEQLSLSINDGSPGTGCPVIASLTGTDYAVIVTEPTISGFHDLNRVLDLVRFFNIDAGVIINKADLNPDYCKKINKTCNQFKIDFLGEINYDSAITLAQLQRKSIIEFSEGKTSKEIRKIWERIKLKIQK